MSRPAAIMLAAVLLFVYVMVGALGAHAGRNARPVSTERIIHLVFGSYGSQAVRVAWCESRLNVWARNGQYENIFQMGYSERKRYGWHVAGSSAWQAARAAYRYFVASGYSWRAWACQP